MSHSLLAARARHPWLDDLVADPPGQVRALVRGLAEIPPYGRADPADAAASLLFGLAPDDPAMVAFDQGCLAVLEQLRAQIPAAPQARWPMRLVELDTLFAMILRLHPRGTVEDLHHRQAYWFDMVETAVLDDRLDLRRGFWRVLALTQDLAPAGLAPRRLMPLWLDICGEAGPRGRYAATYLDVGLLGLRRLPLAADQDGNEEAVCHGLARWAARQRPRREAFEARWAEIEAAYPHSATFWPDLVERVIFVAEEHLSEANRGAVVSFDAAIWWRQSTDLALPRAGQRAPRPARRGPVEPPAPGARERLLQDAAAPIAALIPRVESLMAGHRRYADATGDSYYLVRTACNVGMRLLDQGADAERGEVAERLARLALEHEGTNHYAWALWRNAAAARGALAAAEAIGWETIRRFPEDPQWLNQLATLLADDRGRPDEAAALLRACLARFPTDVAVRPQLARLLADRLGRVEEARALLEDAIAVLPDHAFSYGDLAALLADRLDDRKGAEEVLRRKLARSPDDKIGRNMLASLQAGRRLRRPAADPRAARADDLADPGGLSPALAEARRALFRAEIMQDDAARQAAERLLAADPASAYLRWTAAALGVGNAQARPENAFAFAYLRALREGSAAAFDALTRGYSSGLDRFVAQAGLTLITGGAQFALPPAANDPAAGPPMRRLAAILGGLHAVAPAARDTRNALLLLRDVTASELSLLAA